MRWRSRTRLRGFRHPAPRVWILCNNPCSIGWPHRAVGGEVMKMRIHVALVALLGMLGVMVPGTPSRAETGTVAVVFNKGGFIVGVGGGEGVLVFRGKRYPFIVSGMSVGFTIGASSTKLVGQALNLRGPDSIEGNYTAIG